MLNYRGGLSSGVISPQDRVGLVCEIIGGGTPVGVANCIANNAL
jgi:hypothetical protein